MMDNAHIETNATNSSPSLLKRIGAVGISLAACGAALSLLTLDPSYSRDNIFSAALAGTLMVSAAALVTASLVGLQGLVCDLSDADNLKWSRKWSLGIMMAAAVPHGLQAIHDPLESLECQFNDAAVIEQTEAAPKSLELVASLAPSH